MSLQAVEFAKRMVGCCSLLPDQISILDI